MSQPIPELKQPKVGGEEYIDWRVEALKDPKCDPDEIGLAFQDLWTECLPIACSSIYGLTRASHRVEELSQEVAIKVFQSIAGFTPENAGSLHAWVAKIAHNTTIDMFKREAKYYTTYPSPFDGSSQEADTTVDQSIWGGSNEVSAPEAQAELHELQKIISELPPHFADVIRLRYVEDLSQAQVAQKLGIPLGTARSRIHRGKKHLRRILEDATY